MNVDGPLRRHAQVAPDSIAYESIAGATVTYAAMERSVDGIARRARELGLRPGQLAVVATNDLYRYIVLALALARIGVAHAPTLLPPRRADVALLDAEQQASDWARTIALRDVWRDEPGTDAGATPVTPHHDGAATFMLCPSSGTTGLRKFVPVSHDLAMRRVDIRALGTAGIAGGRSAEAMRMASFIGPGTSYGFTNVLLVLCGGGTVLEPCLDARDLPAWVVRSRVNTLVASPIALRKVLDVLPAVREPNALAMIEVGGGTLPPAVYHAARQRLCANVFINYGLTECGRVAGAPAEALLGKPDAVGYAHRGVDIHIVDDDGVPVPAGHEGTVRIRSERNASGYLDTPPATADVFRDGWVYPGDRGLLEPDGLLHIVGRSDDVINRGGVKVNPQAIEERMMALGTMREVAVFGVSDDSGFTSICAAVAAPSTFDAEGFHERCREELGENAPVFIMHMRELPRNANGKVLRTELARIAVQARRR